MDGAPREPGAALEGVARLWRLESAEAAAALVRALGDRVVAQPAGKLLRLEGGEGAATVHVVLSGWVSLSKSTRDGDRQILDILLPGSVIDPGAADDGTSHVQVEALTPATVAVVPVRAWERLLGAHPEIRAKVDRLLHAALSRMSERMLRLGRGSAESRLAYALIELCLRVSAHEGGDCGAFHIPMTQKQLGDFVGLSPVHVCRTLRRMERHGILSATDHMDVVIHDIDRLVEIAEVDLPALRKEIVWEL